MNPLSLVGTGTKGPEKKQESLYEKLTRKPNTLDFVTQRKAAKVEVAQAGLNPSKGTGKSLADTLSKMGVKGMALTVPDPAPMGGRTAPAKPKAGMLDGIAPMKKGKTLAGAMAGVDKEAGLDPDSRKALRDWLMVRGTTEPVPGAKFDQWPYQSDKAAERLKVADADLVEGLKAVRTRDGKAKMLAEIEAARVQRAAASKGVKALGSVVEEGRGRPMEGDPTLPKRGEKWGAADRIYREQEAQRQGRSEAEVAAWMQKDEWPQGVYRAADALEQGAGGLAEKLPSALFGPVTGLLGAPGIERLIGLKGADKPVKNFVGQAAGGILTYPFRLAADAKVSTDDTAPIRAQRDALTGITMAVPDAVDELATGGILSELVKAGRVGLKGLKGAGRKAIKDAGAKMAERAAERAVERPKEPLVIQIPKEKAGALAEADLPELARPVEVLREEEARRLADEEMLPDWPEVVEKAGPDPAMEAMKAEPSPAASSPLEGRREIEAVEPSPPAPSPLEGRGEVLSDEARRLEAERINQERLNRTQPLNLKELRKKWGEIPRKQEEIPPTVQQEALAKAIEEARKPGKKKGQWWNLDINSPKTDPLDDEFDAGAIIQARMKLGALSEDDFDAKGELKLEVVRDTFNRLEDVKDEVGKIDGMRGVVDTDYLKERLGLVRDFEGPREHYVKWYWNKKAGAYLPDFRRGSDLVTYSTTDNQMPKDVLEMLRRATDEVDEPDVKYVSAAQTKALQVSGPRSKWDKMRQWDGVKGSKRLSEIFDANYDPEDFQNSWITVPKKAVRNVEAEIKRKIKDAGQRGADAEDIVAARYGLTRAEIEGILSTPSQRGFGEAIEDTLGDSPGGGAVEEAGRGEPVRLEKGPEESGPSDYVDPFAEEEEQILRARAERADPFAEEEEQIFRARAEREAQAKAAEPSPPAPFPSRGQGEVVAGRLTPEYQAKKQQVLANVRREEESKYFPVENFSLEGKDGKWYSATGVPRGVELTGQKKSAGWASTDGSGSTFGTRYETKEAWQANRKAAINKVVEGMDAATQTPEDIERQFDYWVTAKQKQSELIRQAEAKRQQSKATEKTASEAPIQAGKSEAAYVTKAKQEIAEINAKKLKTRGDEIRLELAKKRLAVNLDKWEPGMGVGWRPVKGQTNKGYRLVSVDRDTAEAVIRLVADDGRVTYDGSNTVPIGRTEKVELIDLVRDRAYDKLEPKAEAPKAEAAGGSRAIYTTKKGKDVEVEVLEDYGDGAKVRWPNGKEFRVKKESLKEWSGEAPQAGASPRAEGALTKAKEKVPAEPKKNPAIEKLKAAADRLERMAEETQARDRKTNTAKRAREAGYAYEQAEQDKALARTMRRIAEGLETGELKALGVVQSKRDVERLEALARQAKFEADRKLPHWEQESRKGRKFTEDDIPFVRDEPYGVSGNRVRELRELLEKAKGGKKLAEAIGWTRGGETLTLSESFADRLRAGVALIKKTMSNAESVKHISERLTELEAWNRLGLNTRAGKQEVFQEWVKIAGAPSKVDPVKQAELALVGRKIPGFFPTPKGLVEQMVDLADVEPGMKVLEPSAGKGNIADALKERGIQVEAIEPVTDLRTILEAKGHKLVGRDFMEMKEGGYDRIVMNPPFENGQDMSHVRHAYDLVKPGGKVVAIMSEGPFYREDKAAREFREWLESVGGTSEKLPEGSFKESNTGVNTRLVEIEKRADAEAMGPATEAGPVKAAEAAEEPLSPTIESVRRIDLTKTEAPSPPAPSPSRGRGEAAAARVNLDKPRSLWGPEEYRARADELEAKAQRLDDGISKRFESAPGSYITGRSNRKALDKKWNKAWDAGVRARSEAEKLRDIAGRLRHRANLKDPEWVAEEAAKKERLEAARIEVKNITEGEKKAKPLENDPSAPIHMTSAEFAKVSKDYKGVSETQFSRQRTMIRNSTLQAVYLTDKPVKVVKAPNVGEGWSQSREALVKATQGKDQAIAKAARAKLRAGDAFQEKHGVSIGDEVRLTYPNGTTVEGRLDFSPSRQEWRIGKEDVSPRTMTKIEKLEGVEPSPPAPSPSRGRGEAEMAGKPERITDKVQAILKADEPDAFYRAQKGGEVGVNDRWYKGGQFLPISVKGLQESLGRAKKKAGVGGKANVYGMWFDGLKADEIPIVEIIGREFGIQPGYHYGPRFEEGWVNADIPVKANGKQDREAIRAATEAKTGRWTKEGESWQWQVKDESKRGSTWELVKPAEWTAEEQAWLEPWLERLTRGDDRVSAQEFPDLVTENNAFRAMDEGRPLTPKMKERLDEWINELPENQQNAIKMLVEEAEPSPPAPSSSRGRGEAEPSMADLLEPEFELRAGEGRAKSGERKAKPEEDDPNWRMRQEGLPGLGDQAGQFNLMDEPLFQSELPRRKPGPKPKGRAGMAPDDYITEVRDRASFAEGVVKQFRYEPKDVQAIMAVVDARAKTQLQRRGMDSTREALDGWYSENFGWITRDGAMMEDLVSPAAKQEGKGAYMAAADGRAIITAFEAADRSTLLHELGHHFRRNLEPDLDVRTRRHYLPDGGDWDRSAEERFAQDLERYFYDGKAPAPGLVKVFEQIKAWFREVYRKLAGSGLEKGLDVRVRGVFDEMFGGEDPILRAWDPGPDFPAGTRKGGRFKIHELGDEVVDLTPGEQARLEEIRRRAKVWEDAVWGKRDAADSHDEFRRWDAEIRDRKGKLKREIEEFLGTTEAEQRKLDVMRIRDLEDGRDPAFRSIDWDDEPALSESGTLTPAPLPGSKERGAFADAPGDVGKKLPDDPEFKKRAMEAREKSSDFQVWKRSKVRFLKALTEENWQGMMASLFGSPGDMLRLGDMPGSTGREAGEQLMRDIEKIHNIAAAKTVQAMKYLMRPIQEGYGKLWEWSPKAKAEWENMAWKIHRASVEGKAGPEGLNPQQAAMHEAWAKMNGWLVKQGHEMGALTDRVVQGDVGRAVQGEDIWFYGRKPGGGQLSELRGKAVGWAEDALEVEVEGERWWLDKWTPFSTKSLVAPELFWRRQLNQEIKRGLQKGKGLEYEAIVHWIALHNEGLIEGGKPIGDFADFLNEAQRMVTAEQLAEARRAMDKVYGAKESLAHAVGQGARIERQRIPWAFPDEWYDYSLDVAQQHLQEGIRRVVRAEVWGQDGALLHEQLQKMSSPGRYAEIIEMGLGSPKAETPGEQMLKKAVSLEGAWSTISKLTGLGTTVKQLGQGAAGFTVHGAGPMFRAAGDLWLDLVKDWKHGKVRRGIRLSGAIESDLMEVISMDQASGVARKITDLAMTLTGVKPVDKALRYWTAQAGLVATDGAVQKLRLVDAAVVQDRHYRYLKEWVLMDDAAIKRLAETKSLTREDTILAYHAGARTQIRNRPGDMPMILQKHQAARVPFRFQSFNYGQMRILAYTLKEAGKGNVRPLATMVTSYLIFGVVGLELWRRTMAVLENKEPREVPEELGWYLAHAVAQAGMFGLLGKSVENLSAPDNLLDASDDDQAYWFTWLNGQVGEAVKLNIPIASDVKAAWDAVGEAGKTGDAKAAAANMIRRQVVLVNRLAKRGEPDRAFIEGQRKKLKMMMKKEGYTEDAMRAVLDRLFPLPSERKSQDARVQWDRDYYAFVQAGMSPAEAREELGPKPAILGQEKKREPARVRVGDVDEATVARWAAKSGAEKVKYGQKEFDKWSKMKAPAGARQ